MVNASGQTSDAKRPGLQKELKLRQLFTLSLGTIIGVGWITVLGSWLTEAGSLGAVIAFLAGGLLMALIGLCYAEVASMYPVSGGEVAYAYEIFGIKTSFAAGWFLALSYISTVGFEAVSMGWILSAIAPQLEGPVLYRVLGDGVHLGSLLLGLGGMAIITLVNYRGAKSTATFQDVMTYGLVAISLIFITAGIFGGDRANLEPLFVERSGGWAWTGILAVLATTPFWFSGFDVIPQAMPRADLLALELPAAGAFEAAFDSPLFGKIVLFAGLLGIITTWNATFFAGTRVVFALGQGRIIPPAYGAVHPRHQSPARAVSFVGCAGSLMAFLGRNAIIPLVNASAACLAVVFFFICVGVIRLRRTHPRVPRPYRVPGGAAIPTMAVLASLAVAFLALYEPFLSAEGRFPTEWSFFIIWSVLGALFWRSARRIRNQLGEAERRKLILG
jgi:amino acid transporter